MNVLLIKASNSNDVRLSKFVKVLSNQDGNKLSFWGWNRTLSISGYHDIYEKYILSGYSENKLSLVVGYLVWQIKLFFQAIFELKKYDIVYVVDLECAFPIRVASVFINGPPIIYDVYDEFAIRYKFPALLRKVMKSIDAWVRSGAVAIVHVDTSRVSKSDQNVYIIENVPEDIFKNGYTPGKFNRSLAVTGWLNSTRGISSIVEFANANKDIHFIFIGEVKNKKSAHKLKSMDNVNVVSYMPQSKVFELIKDCSGIFALYDPDIEINRKAASNKYFDATLLGIPLITNSGLLMAEKVQRQKIGVVVPYHYDGWFQILEMLDDKSELIASGRRARLIFEKLEPIESQILNLFDKVTEN